jgi:polyhydroxybutyrate depolymerase
VKKKFLSTYLFAAMLQFVNAQNFTPGKNEIAFEFQGRNRTALLYIPDSYSPEKSYPLVMMLHGAGGSTATVVEATGWDVMGNKEGFVTLFPNGTPKKEDNQENFLYNPQTWSSGMESTLAASARSAHAKNIDDVGFLTALIAYVEKQIKIDSSRIYVCGHSNGAGMAYRFAFERSDLVAAVGVMAGHFGTPAPESHMSRPVPLIQILGDKDPFTPIEGGIAGVGNKKAVVVPALDAPKRWALLCGLDTAVFEKEESDSLIEYYWGTHDNHHAKVISLIVKEHGHDYLHKRSRRLPEFFMGPFVPTIDATETFWHFFKQHPKQ